MKTILVPVDFSSNSVAALDYAVKMAARLKAKVELMHVLAVSAESHNTLLGALLYGRGDVKENVDKKLFQLAKKYARKVRITYSITEGVPSVSILEQAKKIKADMIVIGRTGRGAILRYLAGSTVSHVIRKTACKVLVVPPETRFKPFRKIVFATDLRNDNLRFAGPASDLARQFDAELIFLYVDSHFMIHSDEEIQMLTRKMKSKTNYRKISGYICGEMGVKEGIDYFLKHKKADLLVLVTYHLSYPEITWKKSIAQKLSSTAKLPMLVFEKR